MDMNIFDELFTDDALEGVSAVTVNNAYSPLEERMARRLNTCDTKGMGYSTAKSLAKKIKKTSAKLAEDPTNEKLKGKLKELKLRLNSINARRKQAGDFAITVESVTDDDFDDMDDIFDDDEMDDLDGELECAFVGAAMEDDDDDCDLCDDDDIEEFDENLDDIMPFDELDDIDEMDEAEEASAEYYAKKACKANKKTAKNAYLAAQNLKEIAKNPNLSDKTRRTAQSDSYRIMSAAKNPARVANTTAKDLNSGAARYGYSKSNAQNSYNTVRDDQKLSGIARSWTKKDLASARAKESAYDFDFFNEEPNDEVVATESVASLFTTETPAISRDDYTNLFKPATEAAEDDDLDGELLEEDPDIDDEDLDGYTEGEDYSDAEYDRDEELLDDDE